tara:strand:+ start:4706 stop:4963 length:258 start_codon:yes stop_codon:yes gene_type:complete
MKERDKKQLDAAKTRAMQQMFYEDVLIYLIEEYKPRIAKLFTNSPISDKVENLVYQYFWGGNTVQFTAGQVADLLRSKYPKRKRK